MNKQFWRKQFLDEDFKSTKSRIGWAYCSIIFPIIAGMQLRPISGGGITFWDCLALLHLVIYPVIVFPVVLWGAWKQRFFALLWVPFIIFGFWSIFHGKLPF